MALFNSLMIPLEKVYTFEFQSARAYNIVNHFIEFLFVLDMILMFFTSYQSTKGLEILESDLIAQNYVEQTRFMFDTLSLMGPY